MNCKDLTSLLPLIYLAYKKFIDTKGEYEHNHCNEIDEREERGKILAIHSLDELKDKLGKVVIMVLIIGFFKKVMDIDYTTPVDMVCLAGSILMLALALHFIHKPPLKRE